MILSFNNWGKSPAKLGVPPVSAVHSYVLAYGRGLNPVVGLSNKRRGNTSCPRNGNKFDAPGKGLYGGNDERN